MPSVERPRRRCLDRLRAAVEITVPANLIDDRTPGSAWLLHCPDPVPIPNGARATIGAQKLTGYLLNPSHKRGGAKAKLLLSLGYQTDAPEALESDLRTQHLPLDPTRTSQNPYGVAYEIEGSISTPSGRIVWFVSIRQIDTGTDVPRFITMYPR